MAKGKSRAQLQAELNAMRSARTADGWVTVTLSAIRWAAIVAIAHYAYLSIDVLAGQETLADIGISFLGKVEVTVFFAWTIGLVGLVYGAHQRKLRRDTVERLQGRIKHLEEKFDTMRSSSRLTPRGESRPEDVV